MRTYKVVKYQSEYYQIWNEFVAQAKNATFLFHRDFMEYHQDRFEDFSLLVFDSKNVLKAILPANRLGDTVYSHQGLTYGGLIVSKKSKLNETLLIFKEILFQLHQLSISKLQLKSIPSIYTNYPSDELDYLMFVLNAERIRCDALSVIDLQSNYKISSSRLQEIKKTKEFVVKEVFELESFWNEILIPNLKEKHGANPVHTLEEITRLQAQFPKNIRQFNVYLNETLVAGTTIFESDKVVHSQYISGLSKYNQLGGLDFLHHHLITIVFSQKNYFDFGISNENQGKNINHGLLFWKESFGARTIVQNFYEVQTANFINLETVLI